MKGDNHRALLDTRTSSCKLFKFGRAPRAGGPHHTLCSAGGTPPGPRWGRGWCPGGTRARASGRPPSPVIHERVPWASRPQASRPRPSRPSRPGAVSDTGRAGPTPACPTLARPGRAGRAGRAAVSVDLPVSTQARGWVAAALPRRPVRAGPMHLLRSERVRRDVAQTQLAQRGRRSGRRPTGRPARRPAGRPGSPGGAPAPRAAPSVLARSARLLVRRGVPPRGLGGLGGSM